MKHTHILIAAKTLLADVKAEVHHPSAAMRHSMEMVEKSTDTPESEEAQFYKDRWEEALVALEAAKQGVIAGVDWGSKDGSLTCTCAPSKYDPHCPAHGITPRTIRVGIILIKTRTGLVGIECATEQESYFKELKNAYIVEVPAKDNCDGLYGRY